VIDEEAGEAPPRGYVSFTRSATRVAFRKLRVSIKRSRHAIMRRFFQARLTRDVYRPIKGYLLSDDCRSSVSTSGSLSLVSKGEEEGARRPAEGSRVRAPSPSRSLD